MREFKLRPDIRMLIFYKKMSPNQERDIILSLRLRSTNATGYIYKVN